MRRHGCSVAGQPAARNPDASRATTRHDRRVTLSISRADGLVISDDRDRLDVDRIHGWLLSSYWAADRDRPAVERTIANSAAFGVYDPAGEQVAFARAVTDWAAFAWVADVFVAEAWRGRGVGSWLVASIIEHLTAMSVPRIVLATRDAHEVYARLGFEPLRVPSTWMEIDRRPHRLEPA